MGDARFARLFDGGQPTAHGPKFSGSMQCQSETSKMQSVAQMTQMTTQADTLGNHEGESGHEYPSHMNNLRAIHVLRPRRFVTVRNKQAN